MKVVVDEKRCFACGTCLAVCPQTAITLDENHASIDEEKCKQCMLCKKACPAKAIKVIE